MKPKPLSVLAPPFVPEAARTIINARRALVARRAKFHHIDTLFDWTPKARRRLRKLGAEHKSQDAVLVLAKCREEYGAQHAAAKKRTGNDKLPFNLPQ